MALFGQFSMVKTQVVPSAGLAAAFEYVLEISTPGSPARRRIDGLAVGASEKIELSNGVFAIEQVYLTKHRSEGFFESHKKYIDVQVIVEGVEEMEVADISHLTVSEPYLAERDLIKYADLTSASILKLGSGATAVFYPTDGHMTTLQLEGGSKLVRKTVVKVPVV